jgi:type II secretory pathway pseudopilin PulG
MRTRHKKTAFTIVELLTVMSIIVILISLLLPSLNAVKRFSRTVLQKNQFRNIGSGLQIYESDFDEYPDSDADDADGDEYCGAMKLAEVMAGQDGLGFHLDSRLTISGLDSPGGTDLYPPGLSSPYDAVETENLRSRKEYLERRDMQICSLDDLYTSPGGTFSETSDIALLRDAFRSARNLTTGKKMGMPVLYYRADTSRMLHDANAPDITDNIYNYEDNQDFLGMGVPPGGSTAHPLYTGVGGLASQVFYDNILDEDSPIPRPHNKDSYILISAGWDGIYGTEDDVYNFKN